ncbi:Inactive beta-amylase 9 [Striga hermonthica]|uniref:Beta-amylase n=1 Tax=Striga hermonthica TaxID=68872 RepID=A0A9N7MIT8_STRHE|nr:Inactive beta-amylase 9 [Striga hermonthica]
MNVGKINDVCFPNLNAKVFCSVKNKYNNSSKGSQNSVWPSRSAQVFRLRASASVQTQVLVSEKASEVITRTKPNNATKLYVGLPLDTVTSSNTINHARAISAGLKALKLLGVAGVELPVWWGVAENEGIGNYNWTGYLAVVEMVKKLGLEVRVSLGFHACNESKITLPKWVSKIGETDPSIFFTDRTGQRYKDCLTWAVDDLHVLDGKSPMQVYKEFFESFKSTFADYMGSTITGLTIGLGPDGELRYPSHHQPIKCSSLAGPGEFQCYDKHMLADLKRHAELHGHPLWGLGGPHDAPDGFFDASWDTPYGDFFLSWYSTRLLAHGDRVLSLGESIFESSPVELSAKIPLMHGWCKARSHPSELTAGFYNTDNRDGYGPVFEMLSRNTCGAVLCGLDLSGPELLVSQVMESCEAHGVEVSGENSEVSGGIERIKNNLAGRNEVVRSFTYQRMGAHFFSPEHFPEFTRFVRGLNEPDRSLDDLPVVDERSVGSLSGKNLRMQTA